MRKQMRSFLILLLAGFLFLSLGQGYAADVVVTNDGHATTTTTTTTSHWRAADTPVGSLFYFLGDVVAFPFRVLGELF